MIYNFTSRLQPEYQFGLQQNPIKQSQHVHTDESSDFSQFCLRCPKEISEIIFLDLPLTTLLNCRKVSKPWKQLVEKDDIWKSKFQHQKYWKYNNDKSEIDSWYQLYREHNIS